MSTYKPTAKGFFSGAGGFELGLIQCGIEVIQSLDLDPKATSCMLRNRHYFPHKVVNRNIKEIQVLEQTKTDIILGTYPCNEYSNASNIHKRQSSKDIPTEYIRISGDDLFLHFFRHIAIERPEMYIVENVPRMKKYKVTMEAMTNLPDYYVSVFCPVKAEYWLPQKRDRLILIGTKKPFFINQPFNKRGIELKNIIEKGISVHTPDYVYNRLHGIGAYRDKPIIVDPSLPGSLAPCCVAHYSKDLGTRLVKDASAKCGVRPFSIREYARLQGFPDDFIFDDEPYSYKLIGNAVPVPLGRWVGKNALKYFN